MKVKNNLGGGWWAPLIFGTKKIQKDSSDTCDSGYLMREKITFVILLFGAQYFLSLGVESITFPNPGQIVLTVLLPLRHCAAIWEEDGKI